MRVGAPARTARGAIPFVPCPMQTGAGMADYYLLPGRLFPLQTAIALCSVYSASP